MASPQQPDPTQPHALPAFYEAWSTWYRDVFSIYSQVLAAQWRFASTMLGTFGQWLEPGVAMTEHIAEQMIDAVQNITTPDAPPPGPFYGPRHDLPSERR